MPKKEPGDNWEEKKKGDYSEGSAREKIFGEDESSQYIQGAISEASQSEMESADSVDGGRLGRFATRTGEKIAGSSLPELMYKMNPLNYDRIDWIFSLGFVGVFAGALTLFLTESVVMTVASLVGMFLSFCVMLMCIGIEDILKGRFSRLGIGDTEGETEEFQDGESFREEQQEQT